MSHEVRLYTICLEDEGALEVQEALNLATPEEAAEAFFDEALRRGEGEWGMKEMRLPQDAKFIGATKSGSGNIYHCADTYFLASIEITKLNEAQLRKLVAESVKTVLREMDDPAAIQEPTPDMEQEYERQFRIDSFKTIKKYYDNLTSALFEFQDKVNPFLDQELRNKTEDMYRILSEEIKKR